MYSIVQQIYLETCIPLYISHPPSLTFDTILKQRLQTQNVLLVICTQRFSPAIVELVELDQKRKQNRACNIVIIIPLSRLTEYNSPDVMQRQLCDGLEWQGSTEFLDQCRHSIS